MNASKVLHRLVGMLLVVLVATGCGSNARFDMYPTTGHTVIILSNYTAPVDGMADKLGEIIIKGQES